MIKLVLFVLFFWCYRQIGVLRYKIDGASTGYDSSNVYFPSAPSLGVYFLWRYVTRRFFIWKPICIVCFYPIGGSYKHLLRDYKKIYFWPTDVFREIRSNHKYGAYRLQKVADKRAQSYPAE